MKKLILIIKKYFWQVLFFIVGILVYEKIKRSRNNHKSIKFLKKVGETEHALEKLEKEKVKKDEYKKNSRADNVGAIRDMLKRWRKSK